MLPGSPSEITSYYRLDKEHDRLTRGLGVIEFARTCDLLARFLPSAPAQVLDIGGGTAVYARWLTQQGYETHLLDVMPEHVERARAALSVASAAVGDARQLDLPAKSMDAALLMGPLYHLTELDDRLQALREAHRVLRPGGTLIAAGIPHTAAVMGDLTRNLTDEDYGRVPRETAFRSGQYRNPEGRPGYFTTAYFHRPADLEAEIKAVGFASKGVYAVEGPATLLRGLDEVWQDEARRAGLMVTLKLLEREPSLLGVSPHIVVPATKAEY